MKTIKWHCNTGFAGCKHKGEIEVDDDATEKEIDDQKEEQHGSNDKLEKIQL